MITLLYIHKLSYEMICRVDKLLSDKVIFTLFPYPQTRQILLKNQLCRGIKDRR